MNSLDQIIEKCLLLKGRMILPGWGVLSIHRSSASINPSQGVIYPPGEEVTFLEVPQLEKRQLKSELTQFVFSAPVDVDRLADQITEYAAAKKAEGHWQIGRLGTLSVLGDQLNWNASPVAEWSAMADLPDIRLPNAVASGESSTHSANGKTAMKSGMAETSESPQEEGVSSRSLFIILVLVLLLALSMIIGSLWYWGPLSNGPLTEVDLPVQKERLNVKPDEVESSVKRTSVQHMSPDSSASFELNHRKMAVDAAPNDSESSATSVESETAENELDENAVETPESESQNCVIIVGAFSKEVYVQKMQALVSAKGYQVYEASVGGLTRVGLYAPCAPPDILAELRTVRKEIESGAWILNE